MIPVLMLDVECLSLKTDARVIQLGLYAKDLRSGKELWSPSSRYPVDSEGSMDLNTIKWWLKQDKEIIRSVFLDKPEDYVARIYTEIKEFTTAYKDLTVWAKPALFDMPILENMFCKLFFKEPPWHYRSIRCLQQEIRIRDRQNKLAPPQNERAHNAEADCVWQMQYLQNLYDHAPGFADSLEPV